MISPIDNIQRKKDKGKNGQHYKKQLYILLCNFLESVTIHRVVVKPFEDYCYHGLMPCGRNRNLHFLFVAKLENNHF